MQMETNHLPVRTDAFTQVATPDSPPIANHIMAAFPAAKMRLRRDGWTPEKQRLFCETLADCGLVKEAVAAVGMSVQSAYCLRRRPEGRAFALGWDAALLLARRRLIDLAIERAVEGNSDVLIKDGVVVAERKRQDVRHLLTAITKLTNIQRDDQIAKEISAEFDDFLDCAEADATRAIAISQGDAEQAGQVFGGSAVYNFLECREPADPRQRREHSHILMRLKKPPQTQST